MKKITQFSHALLFVAACGLFAACGNKEEKSTDNATTSAAEVAAAPTEQWMVLLYDAMRLREAPNQDGKVLATLKQGAQVLSLGELSENEETVTLRGVPITAPWAKVRTKEGQEGWIFAGAMKPAPDPAVTAFADQLKAMPQSGCENLGKATDLYVSTMTGKSTAIADQAMEPLLDYLEATALAENSAIESWGEEKVAAYMNLFYDAPTMPLNEECVAQKKVWEDCGIASDFPEGMIYLHLKPGYCLPKVSGLVSPQMKKYLELKERDETEGFSEDAGLVISPMELAERIIRWDDFLGTNPGFVFGDRAAQQNRIYLGSLMGGENNTPAFEWEGAGVVTEFKAAWEWMLKNHPDSPSSKTMKEWVDLVKANGWKTTAKTEAYLKKFWDAFN